MTDAPRRRRVLVAAYACGPGDESEASAGWAFARAAARDHDVWVVTRRRFAESIETVLTADPQLAAAMTVIHLDLSDRVLAWKKRGRDVYWYYALWQRRLARTVQALDAEVGFDVVHHLTFAVDWLPCGLARVPGIPFVWGPVGGATYTPRPLLRSLGPRAAIGELTRDAMTRLARRCWGDVAARRAGLVVAQNADVARRFRHARAVVVEPNAAFGPLPPPGRPRERTAVFAARLLPWKGCHLAIAALARPAARGWTLEVFGDGPQRPRLEALAARLGVAERVVFRGQRPRAEVLEAVGTCTALLFPSMHDAAGWAVGEASALGRPVICLDVGGPPTLAGPNAIVVAPDRDVVRRLADALETSRELPTRPFARWSADRLPDLVTGWYATVLAAAPDSR